MKKSIIAFVCVVAAAVVAASSADPWTSGELVQPQDFAAVVAGKTAKPDVYYVGFNVLYRSKHIPGAVFAGPAAQQDGIALLKKALANLSRDKEIVLYCGCCPIDKCPNLRPAFTVAKQMGFKKVKVLMLPTSFGIDWVEKGYPFEAGVPRQ